MSTTCCILVYGSLIRVQFILKVSWYLLKRLHLFFLVGLWYIKSYAEVKCKTTDKK